ncbi:cyclic pyranopterin monophosphate synthase MoaC [Halorutilales archaeon Cl-col2-1]
MTEFTHIEDDRARMVDISDKEDIERVSVARGRIDLQTETVDAIREGDVEKGNVLSVARVAGIQAVKRTWDNIPMCHQIPITGVTVDFEFDDNGIQSVVEVTTTGKTGVEMEALSGVSASLLTVWDMVKSAEKDDEGQYPDTAINDVRVEEKIKKN